MKKQKKGFTLVELSIVLVIIGLLIGGILVGQSLIESAKMQSFVRQMAQYDALTASFKSKYRYLPGDALSFGCTNGLDGTSTPANSTTGVAALCNNNVIEGYNSSGDILFAGEASIFWKQLSDSGFRPEGVSYIATIPATNTVSFKGDASNNANVPKAGIGTAGVAVYGNAGVNYYLVGGYAADFAINVTAGLTATDSVAFDKKVDDGVANTGDVVVGLAVANASCNDAGVYDIANGGSSLVCSLRVKMMANTNF